jgi:transposase-like protein
MQDNYRIIFETYHPSSPDCTKHRKEIVSGELNKPNNILDFGMGLAQQVKMIESVQDNVISHQLSFQNDKQECPSCKEALHKTGKHQSWFHDVFTDHKVSMQRWKCHYCKYEAPSTINTLIGDTSSGELKKIQADLGANHSFRESERILSLFADKRRPVNNHERVKRVVESVGDSIMQVNLAERDLINAPNADELIVNIDGGHIKTTEDQRSIEALVSVVHRPESIKKNKKGTRNYIEDKHCAASTKNDNQVEIISGTVIAALKQGLNDQTHITALCDGAQNCWNVAKALEPMCKSITYILDWFHVAMKYENISLPKDLKEELMGSKWHLWRGDVDKSLTKLEKIIESTEEKKHHESIRKLYNYIDNNRDKIVNYNQRKELKLVFTSSFAESSVESLINQRCKGMKHMRWSREGLNPVLQLRAAIHSNSWCTQWQTAVLNAS